jgi:hypothetical protein
MITITIINLTAGNVRNVRKNVHAAVAEARHADRIAAGHPVVVANAGPVAAVADIKRNNI